MRIAIITFHNTSNFGATLQCYALFSFLKKMGHEVEVINYMPVYVREKKGAGRELRKINKSNNKAKAVVKGLALLLHTKDIGRKNDRFDSFIRKNLNLSAIYPDYTTLTKNTPNVDLYICGSDQIWNSELTGGNFDKAFFLSFAKGSKASYAASFGELNIEEHKQELASLTQDFIGISVREKSTAKRLSTVLDRQVVTSLDCTLLLDKDQYYKVEEAVEGLCKPFLLLYNIQNSSISSMLAKKIAEEKKLDIVDISSNPFEKIPNTRKLNDIGPGEFLYLFHNASYVVTNSFHGTAFSIIYGKQFVTVPHSKRAARVVDLLEILGLKSRIALESGFVYSSTIDYCAVYDRLLAAREQSISYLRAITSTDGMIIKDLSGAEISVDERFTKESPKNKHFPSLVEQRVMCCGCAACMNICRQSAIEMWEDSEGFLYPHVNADLCIKCYMCESVCAFKDNLGF